MQTTFFSHFSGASSFPVVCRAITAWMIAHDRTPWICDLRQQTLQHSDELEQELRGVPRVAAFDQLRVLARMESLKRSYVVPRDDIVTDGIGLLFGFPEWAWACPTYKPFIGYHVCDGDRVPEHWPIAINEICDVVLTPSKWCAGVLKSAGVARRIHVVRHGIDPEVFKPGPATQQKGTMPKLRFFCSSESGMRKGLFELVAAWKILWQRKPGFARLVVRGAGPLVRRAFGTLPGVVVEVGEPMRPAAMAKVLRETDLLLVPSRAEGFSLMPLQSVACETPVITTDCTGCSEWAHTVNGGFAYVESGDMQPCPSGPGLPGRAPGLDAGHLADVIENAVRDLDELKAGAAKASVGVRRKWSWDAVLTGSMLDKLTAG